MSYFFRSLATRSFWRYALLSWEGAGAFFAAVGGLYTFLEILDFFSIYRRDQYSHYAIIPIFFAALVIVVLQRRPLKRFTYKFPGRDLCIEVKLGDLFSEAGDVVVSSSTTFDTDVASGLISANSLQGQLAATVFAGNTRQIDELLALDLQGVECQLRLNAPGKKEEYPIGTVSRVNVPPKTYYFVAMSRMNDDGNAQSSVRMIEDALSHLWTFIRTKGNLKTLIIPVLGTGRGRIEMPRKKMIERISQSFADASKEYIFSNWLVIVVRPEDAEDFQVNLFEIRDYLMRSLHF